MRSRVARTLGAIVDGGVIRIALGPLMPACPACPGTPCPLAHFRQDWAEPDRVFLTGSRGKGWQARGAGDLGQGPGNGVADRDLQPSGRRPHELEGYLDLRE